jgi:hypothetical protein
MRFGLVVLFWMSLWGAASTAELALVSALRDWLNPPQVEALSEEDAEAMKNGMICTPGEFEYSADPDWATKCCKEI